MEERGVWWSGGTEPENCIACSVISLPPGCLPPPSSNSPLSPQVPSHLHSLLLVSLSRHFRRLSSASGSVTSPLRTPPPPRQLLPLPPLPFLMHTLGGSILDLSLRLEKFLLPPNLKVTQLGPFFFFSGGGGSRNTNMCASFFFHSKKTQGDEHRSVNQMRARPRGSPAN